MSSGGIGPVRRGTDRDLLVIAIGELPREDAGKDAVVA
jgi:hypothetical protein